MKHLVRNCNWMFPRANKSS